MSSVASAAGAAVAVVCAAGGGLYCLSSSSSGPSQKTPAASPKAPSPKAPVAVERAEEPAEAPQTELAPSQNDNADEEAQGAPTGLYGQSPVSTELLEQIDALYGQLRLHEVKDVLDSALDDEKAIATVVQLRQFRASVLFGVGKVEDCVVEYAACIDIIREAGDDVQEDTAEQVNQFWAILAALHKELGDENKASDCLEEAESNGMLRAEAESLGAEIVAGYKEDASHFEAKQRTGEVPEEFMVKVKATTAVQKVSEMEAQDHVEASERAQNDVEETGQPVQVQVPEGAQPGQQVPCQTAAGMPAHMITIPMVNQETGKPTKSGDTINVKLPKLDDLPEERLLQFVQILSEAIDAGSKHPNLIATCLAKRAMHYLLLGELDKSLADLGNLLAVTEHKPVDVDPTAAEAFIMSGFVHRLAVMGCVQEDPPSGLAISHERKATASFTAATQLGVKNLQESIGMMESEIQRASKVRVIIEAFARSQPMQQVMAKQQPGGSSKDTESKQVKKEIRLGSDAFKAEDYVSAVSHFSKALAMKPSQKWLKWLYKNRAVCYKHTKQWEQMAADAHESCKLEEAVPENYLRRAVALKQLKGRSAELAEVCKKAAALDMPEKLRAQLDSLMK